MIGNDIVDLKHAAVESNWKRKGFLDKIFTKQEQQIILSSSKPDEMVWNLWSRKEAAYKIWNRITNKRIYNPLSFECFEVENEMGSVVFRDFEFHTKTQTNSEFVYSIAIIKNYSFNTVQHNKKVLIVKENGIPYADYIGNKSKIVSKTHHGRFEKIVTIG